MEAPKQHSAWTQQIIDWYHSLGKYPVEAAPEHVPFSPEHEAAMRQNVDDYFNGRKPKAQ